MTLANTVDFIIRSAARENKLLTTDDVVAALGQVRVMFQNSRRRMPPCLRRISPDTVRRAMRHDKRFIAHRLPGQPLRWGINPLITRHVDEKG